ncbi:MAG: 16S rRNA (guanine(527)-N(7))-methyltransferase RsmG [Novosphingobium sp.]
MIASEAEARDWLRRLPEWDDTAQGRLELLAAMLTGENTRQNLVSAASLAEVWLRHVADSAQLLTHVPRETCSPWLDLGTGAGFPGLVVAALRPECEVVMVESRSKRTDWLERARESLGLDRARVVASRLELVETFPSRVISARAFAPLDKLLHLSARFSTSETLWLLPKGRSARDELDSLSGWKHLFHVEQSLTDALAGVIVGRLIGKKGAKS